MKSGLKTCVVFLAIVGLAGIAQAIPVGAVLSISDGVDPSITVFDNTTGDLNPATGELTMSTNIGVWSLSISTGVTAPALGSLTNPVMDLVIQASSTGAGSLTYTFSDLNYSAPTGSVNAIISGQVFSGTQAKVDYSVYGSVSNTVNTLTTLLATTGTNALPLVTSASGALTLSSPFSLSQVVQLTASGATSVSVDASLSAVPEPSTVALTFLGLVSLVGLAGRRRSRRCVG